jgi:group I intron endonuclease
MQYEKIYNNLHFLETQNSIKDDNKHKAGVYMIKNNVNQKKYIGSAITNRINSRFRNHLLHNTGSRLVGAAVAKYGIENFSFYILEYFSEFVKKENLSAAHLKLLERETHFITVYRPEYNILQVASSSVGYLHTDLTKSKMKENYSQQRKDTIGALNRGKTFSEERRQLFSKIAKLRNSNQILRQYLSKLSSKPVTLYNQDLTVHSRYGGIRAMAKAFGCCNKTINKAIKDKSVFRNIGIIKLDHSKI